MYELMKEWITSIIMVVIFLALVDMILPDGGLKKYTKLVTGLIVIIVILKPVFNVLGSKGILDSNLKRNMEIYSEAFADSAKSQNDYSIKGADLYGTETISVYRKNLSEKIEMEIKRKCRKSYVVNRLLIEDKHNNEMFLKVSLIELKKRQAIPVIESVKKIRIQDTAGSKQGNETENSQWDKSVADLLVDSFGIDESAIRFVR